MKLYEALEDIGKGRFKDFDCDRELIALAKGVYTFREERKEYSITLDGTPAENAERIQKEYYRLTDTNNILSLDYRRL